MSAQNEILDLEHRHIAYWEQFDNHYSSGFRDAQYQAAEIASKLDSKLDKLLPFLQDIADNQYSDLNDLERVARKLLKDME